MTDSVPTTAGVAGSALTAEEATARNRKLEGELISVMRDLASAKRDYELDVQALEEATDEDRSAEVLQELQKTKDASFKRLFVLEASRQDINDDRRGLLEVVRAHITEDDEASRTRVERMIAALDLVTNSVYTPELRSFYVTEVAPTVEVSAEDQAVYAALLEDVDFAPQSPKASPSAATPVAEAAEATPASHPAPAPVSPSTPVSPEAQELSSPLLRRRDRRRGRPEESAATPPVEHAPESASSPEASSSTSLSMAVREEPPVQAAPPLRLRRSEPAPAPIVTEEPLVETISQESPAAEAPAAAETEEPFTLDFEAPTATQEASDFESTTDFFPQARAPEATASSEDVLFFADDVLAALIDDAPVDSGREEFEAAPSSEASFEDTPVFVDTSESEDASTPSLPTLPPISGVTQSDTSAQRRRPTAGGVPIAPLRRRGSGILPTAPVGGVTPPALPKQQPAPKAPTTGETLSPEALRKAQELQAQADEEREAHRQSLAAEAAARMAGGASSHPFREEGGAEEAFAQPLPEEISASKSEEEFLDGQDEPVALQEGIPNHEKPQAHPFTPPPPTPRHRTPTPGGSLISRLLRRQEQDETSDERNLTRRTFRKQFAEKLPEEPAPLHDATKAEIRRVISAAEPVRRMRKKKTTTNDFLRLLGEAPQDEELKEEEEIDYTFDLFGGPISSENEPPSSSVTPTEYEGAPLELHDLEDLDLFGAAPTLPQMTSRKPIKTFEPSAADFAALIADDTDPEEVPEVVNFLEGGDTENVPDNHAFITDDDDELPADYLDRLVDDDELTATSKPLQD